MMELGLIIICLTCAFLVVYHHIGYPLLLKWYSKKHPLNHVQQKWYGYRKNRRDQTRPSITIVVPAFNEEQWIAEKIRNIASLDYPRDRLKVIIACDGCTDNTVEEAQMTLQEAICADTHIEVKAYSENLGKVAVINRAMEDVDTDITALSDVSALIAMDALIVADTHFKNDHIGVVNATYQLRTSSNEGERKYWEYQNQVKTNETALGSSLGSHGALFFFRTDLFTPLAANTINDDFVLPMKIVEQGYQAIYDSNMVSVELEPTDLNNDFKRRLRISAGNMQQAITLASLFNPKFRGTAFTFFSGKGLRLISPYLMISCLISSALLSSHLLFMAMFITQVTAYSIGLLGHLLPNVFSHKICRWLSYLLIGHFANLVGGLRYLIGLESSPWTRVNR